MRRALGRIALVLVVAWFGVVLSPAEHVAAAALDSAPTAAQPKGDNSALSAPSAGAQAPQPSPPDENTAPGGAPAAASATPGASTKFAETLCKGLGGAALENGLPAEFFVRLIWQESRFDIHSVSRKGAKGIAQFMPGTARWRGLADPFEPIQALRQAARWLRELREQFGNLGLAAAAYNSGPHRVEDWLHGRGKLPGETRDYVRIITGRTTDEWVKLGSDAGTKDFALASVIPCSDIPKVLAREPHPLLTREPNTSSEDGAGAIASVAAREPYPPPERAPNPPSEQSTDANATGASSPWGLQLTGSWSEAQALAAYRDLQGRFPAILGDRPPLVLHGPMAGRGSAPWFRVRVTESSRERAEDLCARLERAGGKCLVFRN